MSASENTNPPAVRSDGLQLQEPVAFQRRFWRVQRAGWILFILVVLSALLGATGGGGVLSRQQIVLDGTKIDLPRISRWEDSDKALVEFPADGPYTVAFGDSFSRSFVVEGIFPRPAREAFSDKGTRLEFDRSDGGTHSVTIALRPSGPGLVTFDVSAGHATQSCSVLILP